MVPLCWWKCQSSARSQSDFALLFPASCYSYSQLNPPLLGAVSQLFSEFLSRRELVSLPTSCTCSWLLDIKGKCVRCSVKSLAVLETHPALESMGQSTFVFSLCHPFLNIIRKVMGLAASSISFEKCRLGLSLFVVIVVINLRRICIHQRFKIFFRFCSWWQILDTWKPGSELLPSRADRETNRTGTNTIPSPHMLALFLLNHLAFFFHKPLWRSKPHFVTLRVTWSCAL